MQRDDHPHDLSRALAWRVARQRLEPRGHDLLEVTATICGLHAQLMSSVELTAWARLERPASVADALWQAALSTYDHFRKPAWTRMSGIAPDELDLVIDAIGGGCSRIAS